MTQSLRKLQDKTLISLFNKKNRTGIAIFDGLSDQITLSSVIEIEASNFQNLLKFLSGFRHDTEFIVPQRCSKDFLMNLNEINAFNKQDLGDPEDVENVKQSKSLEEPFFVLNKSDFDYNLTVDILMKADFTEALEQDNQSVIDFWQKQNEQQQGDKEKTMYLKKILDMDNVEMMSALGGLLNFLFKLAKLKRSFNICRLKMKQPQKNVYVSLKTYHSLSIIKEEIHPSQIKGKGRSKEGFSVFNLYDSMISTTHGKKLLRNWFLNPTSEIDTLEERCYAVDFLLSRLSLDSFDKVRIYLKKIYDMVPVLNKFQNNCAKKDHWRKLSSSIENFLKIKNLVQTIVEEKLDDKDKSLPLVVRKILQFEESELVELQSLLVATLKFRDNTDRIEINSGVDEILDNLRKFYDNLDDILTYYAKIELENLGDSTNQKLCLTYIPHFGYLVSIPKTDSIIEKDMSSIEKNWNNKSQRPAQIQEMSLEEDEEKSSQKIEIIVAEDWIFQFETTDFYYFKSKITNELDEVYGDIKLQVSDIELELLQKIEKQILEKTGKFIEMGEIIANFDCIFCYTQIARNLNLVQPQLTTESNFLIKNGRHILSEISSEQQFIPNDYFVYNYVDDYDHDFDAGPDSYINRNHSNRLTILTGPNFSGKSIYLKQIGIITFLCHIGSFVPASLCKIGLVDGIYASIHLTETILDDDYGFSEEIQNLSRIFRSATNRSLILLDEFGKNTSHSISLGAAIALVKNLTEKNFKINKHFIQSRQDHPYEQIPTTIYVTHHNEMFKHDLVSESYLIRFVTMEVIVQNKNNFYSFVKEENLLNKKRSDHHHINMKEGIQFTSLDAQDKVIFMYKIKAGFSVNSFAILCAKQLGFNLKLLSRINEIQNRLYTTVPMNSALEEKYYGTTRDCLYKINDFLYSLKT